MSPHRFYVSMWRVQCRVPRGLRRRLRIDPSPSLDLNNDYRRAYLLQGRLSFWRQACPSNDFKPNPLRPPSGIPQTPKPSLPITSWPSSPQTFRRANLRRLSIAGCASVLDSLLNAIRSVSSLNSSAVRKTSYGSCAVLPSATATGVRSSPSPMWNEQSPPRFGR